MAYTEPPAWAHGQADTNLVAGLNIVAANLTHFSTAHPGVAGVTCSGGGEYAGSDDTRSVTHRRAHRWLIYMVEDDDDPTALTLLHADPVEDKDFSTTLDGEEGKTMYFDLDTIDWLLPGMAYIVRNVVYAFELDLEAIDA